MAQERQFKNQIIFLFSSSKLKNFEELFVRILFSHIRKIILKFVFNFNFKALLDWVNMKTNLMLKE